MLGKWQRQKGDHMALMEKCVWTIWTDKESFVTRMVKLKMWSSQILSAFWSSSHCLKLLRWRKRCNFLSLNTVNVKINLPFDLSARTERFHEISTLWTKKIFRQINLQFELHTVEKWKIYSHRNVFPSTQINSLHYAPDFFKMWR